MYAYMFIGIFLILLFCPAMSRKSPKWVLYAKLLELSPSDGEFLPVMFSMDCAQNNLKI